MKGQFPWIGRSRGSAGGMTTAKINDKNVMRAKAYDVTNPKTAAQVMQRNFFKEVQEVCASVTEDQLRSLFGVKPKTMTRRNALSKQIAAAYTIEDGVKSVDFYELDAIGNGSKVNTAIVHFNSIAGDEVIEWQNSQLNIQAPESCNIILVIFNVTKKSIIISNTNILAEDQEIYYEDFDVDLIGDEIYCYVTCPTDGRNHNTSNFGSFNIKTRATD